MLRKKGRGPISKRAEKGQHCTRTAAKRKPAFLVQSGLERVWFASDVAGYLEVDRIVELPFRAGLGAPYASLVPRTTAQHTRCLSTAHHGTAEEPTRYLSTDTLREAETTIRDVDIAHSTAADRITRSHERRQRSTLAV